MNLTITQLSSLCSKWEKEKKHYKGTYRGLHDRVYDKSINHIIVTYFIRSRNHVSYLLFTLISIMQGQWILAERKSISCTKLYWCQLCDYFLLTLDSWSPLKGKKIVMLVYKSYETLIMLSAYFLFCTQGVRMWLK